MRIMQDKLVKYSKKLKSSIKKAFRKLKYLDKTQLNYFIVTGFIGTFCMFTGVTYSAFTISRFLNAATITIAKLDYTLAISGVSGNVVTVPANTTQMYNITLTSNNSIDTRYALNYSPTTNGDVTVYYSQSLANNMTGIIAANGSISMRVVIKNDSSSSVNITLAPTGGYTRNSLTTNITQGYYETDINVRTVLLNNDFSVYSINGTTFPSAPGYAYYRTVCNEEASPVWNYAATPPSLTLNNTTSQISCDVYFKAMSSDLEIAFRLVDTDGSETYSSSAPASTTGYSFYDVTCDSSGATATWDDTNGVTVSGADGVTLCVATFVKATAGSGQHSSSVEY